MIQSSYLKDIINLIIEDLQETASLKSQIPYLVAEKCEHTDVGMFVSFKHIPEQIEPFRISKDMILTGVQVEAAAFENGADATLWVTNGIISSLGILALGGNYPTEEIINYKLVKIWQDD